MISRARIVIGETAEGKIEMLHGSFDAVAAVKAFNETRANSRFIEIATFEHGTITRVAKPAHEVATLAKSAKPAEPTEPPSEPPKSKAKK